MSDIRILDCTLRDGGYCNEWTFGEKNIHAIVEGLVEANIDIIECGYISKKEEYDINKTIYSSFEQVGTYIPLERDGKLFVGMINCGDYDIDNIPDYDGTSLDGIRVAFHKSERLLGLKLCEQIKKKGYKVFVQGMVSLSYSDEEFIDLIHEVNKIEPYAFYIVDSFGMMTGNDLTRLYYIVEHNLSPKINIGFHAHNNMQLAYSNCLALTNIQNDRSIIIDASIYGMGRGAGNLNTELFTEYLNVSHKSEYRLAPLLAIVDEILEAFYKKNYWGYSLSNYISAKNNAHPNYSRFLDDKKTLNVSDIDKIFQLMDEHKKMEYDNYYIEDLYTKYLAREKVQNIHGEELKEKFKGKKIVLVAPGKSSDEEKEKIKEYAKDAVCISINFDYSISDFIFLSNLRRYRELGEESYGKCIATSNIINSDFYYQTQYRELLNNITAVKDNAGLMAIIFLSKFDISEIALAGFDGYSHEAEENYANKEMEIIMRNAVMDAMNEGMTKVISDYSKKMNIHFLTEPRYVKILE